MNTLKRIDVAALVVPRLQIDDTVPVHMFTSVENAQGAVLCNVDARLVVLNLMAADNVAQVIELAETALSEMDSIGTGTLIYDTRYDPKVVGLRGDLAARARVLRCASVTRLAMLVAPETPTVEAESIQRMLVETKIEVVRGNVFSDLMSALHVGKPVRADAWAAAGQDSDFVANYGGSVFSVPELHATVIRTSGNQVSSEYFWGIFQAAWGLHLRSRSSTLIFDTSDSPLMAEVDQCTAFHETIIAPLASLGLASTLVHVRLDEGDARGEGIFFEETCAKWDVFGCETSTLEEAFALVRVLKGRPTKAAPASSGFVLEGI